MIPSQPYKLPSPEQMKENPVMPPTPAERLSIHKVKNGWTLDVDYAAMRQFGDSYASPGYVYTKVTRLVSDVLGFLLNGKEAESDFVGKHLSIHAKDPVEVAEMVRIGKQTAWVERDEAITLSNSLRFQRDVAINEGNKAIKERDQCRKELNDAYARGKHEGETNERDEARTECDRLTEKLNTVMAEGRMAWSKGRQSGIDFIMGMVKKHSAEYAEKWVGFFGGVE
jgi:hypothetical protein